MPSELELKFSDRVSNFLKKRDISIDPKQAVNLMDFLYKEFEKQGRLNNKSGFFKLTPQFMKEALTHFLKIPSSEGVALFRSHPMKQFSPRYKGPLLEVLPQNTRYGKGLIGLIGRKHKPAHKITKPDGSTLTPSTKSKVKRQFAHPVSFSPVVLLKRSRYTPRERAVDEKGAEYEEVMTSYNSHTQSYKKSLWRMRTPQPDKFFSPRVRFEKPPVQIDCESDYIPPPRSLDFSSYNPDSKKMNKTESFNFTVTKALISERITARRPVSQKQVMGSTAIEILQALGAIISDKQNGRNFHWAHRQGWSLHGDQAKENLDPMTAGSNYDTLFKVEAPIKRLLFSEKGVNEVNVDGQVVFDEDTGLPFKITYRLSCGNNSVEVVIDPMSERVPTEYEHELASEFVERSIKPSM